MTDKYRILCVCMGNICRSPTARALLLRHLRLTGLQDRVEVESAATHDFHIGKPPDRRAQQALQPFGLDIRDDLARRVSSEDFARFDELLVMDRHNLQHLPPYKPDACRARVALIMDDLPDYGFSEVPDPYYGGAQGFVQVVDMLDQVAAAICRRLASQLEQASGGR